MTERRSMIRWLSACSIVPMLAVALASVPTGQTLAATNYTVYNSPSNGQTGDIDNSEIIDITPDNKYAVVVGARDLGERRLYIATLNPTSGIVVNQLDLDAAVTGKGLINPLASSVAMHPTGRYALITIREGGTPAGTASEQPGLAIFVNVSSAGQLSLVTDPVLTLGVRPESVDIAGNGEFAVVANENSGSVSIIDLDPAGSPTGSVAQTLTPPNVNNPDPESVAISSDNQRAYIPLETSGDIAIVSIGSPLSGSTIATADISNGGTMGPDGIAVTPDGQYVLTANELNDRVNVFQVNNSGSTPSLDLIETSGSDLSADSTPEMVAIGTIGGQLRAFVTLENKDAVAVFKLTPASTDKLEFETEIPLNRTGQPNADGPEGIAIGHGRDIIVTANAFSNNISVIVTDRGLTRQAWLPIAVR